jgi:hypothetical protein
VKVLFCNWLELKVHEDDFKSVLEENMNRKIIFKDIFEAVDVEDGNIDWKYLTSASIPK